MAINQSFKFKQIRHKTNKIIKGLEMKTLPTEKELRKFERDCRNLQAKARSWGVNPIRDNIMGRTMAKLRKRMTLRAAK
jgi:hypothetical protein